MSSDIQDMQRQREIGWFGPKLKLHELRRQQRECRSVISPDFPKLILDLCQLANDINAKPGMWSRLRFAVTPQEYAEIEKFMLERHGKSYGRVSNVPLVVDEDATDPKLSVVYAPPRI